MKRILCTCLLSVILPALAPSQSIRRITGRVLLPDGKPAQGAIVKLQNQVGEIRTAISTSGGSFQFSSLLPDVDYQVRARLGGMESNGVRWTRWSSRKQRDVTLRLRVRRAARSSRSDGFRIGTSAPSQKLALMFVNQSSTLKAAAPSTKLVIMPNLRCHEGVSGTFDLS